MLESSILMSIPGDKHAEERFKEINEAYEVLSDPAKRKMYDRFGAQWQRNRDAGVTGDDAYSRRTQPGSNAQDFTSWFTDSASSTFRTGFGEHSGSFAEFVQTLFGNLGRRGDPTSVFSHAARRRRGEDVEVELEISFDEAFTGTTRRVDLHAQEPCSLCKGSGIARGAVCPACDGAGVVKRAKTIEVKIPAWRRDRITRPRRRPGRIWTGRRSERRRLFEDHCSSRPAFRT
ncbi:MAG: hypothetical protein KatS3mg059_0815 [Thermomicrobiales bacterium]|nr:MAG: hypothetical protein KatS3mg059_0815 [Thermomicrobiales bacterium]